MRDKRQEILSSIAVTIDTLNFRAQQLTELYPDEDIQGEVVSPNVCIDLCNALFHLRLVQTTLASAIGDRP